MHEEHAATNCVPTVPLCNLPMRRSTKAAFMVASSRLASAHHLCKWHTQRALLPLNTHPMKLVQRCHAAKHNTYSTRTIAAHATAATCKPMFTTSDTWAVMCATLIPMQACTLPNCTPARTPPVTINMAAVGSCTAKNNASTSSQPDAGSERHQVATAPQPVCPQLEMPVGGGSGSGSEGCPLVLHSSAPAPTHSISGGHNGEGGCARAQGPAHSHRAHSALSQPPQGAQGAALGEGVGSGVTAACTAMDEEPPPPGMACPGPGEEMGGRWGWCGLPETICFTT